MSRRPASRNIRASRPRAERCGTPLRRRACRTQRAACAWRRNWGKPDVREVRLGLAGVGHATTIRRRSDTPVGPLAMVGIEGRGRMSEHTETPKLSGQCSKALVYAECKHHNQVRKGGDIPYVGHLLSVASLVINDGGTEEQAIAALLHDTVEDQGDPPRWRRSARTSATRRPHRRRMQRHRRGAQAALARPQAALYRPPRQRRARHAVGLGGRQAGQRASMLRDYHTHGPSLWASTERIRRTISGTTRACSRPIARTASRAGWSTNSAG